MRSRALPLIGAVALGFTAALACFTLANPRPASAQLGGRNGGSPIGNGGLPPLNGPVSNFMAGQPQPPQPLEIQGLGPNNFVVATREPRLVTNDGKTAQNMLLTVVTYYTVRENRLVPIEHAKVPLGYQLVTVEQ